MHIRTAHTVGSMCASTGSSRGMWVVSNSQHRCAWGDEHASTAVLCFAMLCCALLSALLLARARG
jgi:hypothetical protein